MKRQLTQIIFLIVAICCSACNGTGNAATKNDEAFADSFSIKDIEGLNPLEAIDKIALTNPKSEDYRGKEINAVLSKVNDPKLLFDYFAEFDRKGKEALKNCGPDDIKCLSSHRYLIAQEVIISRLSEIRNEEAIKSLALIIEKGFVSGNAHLSEELVENIAEIGEPTLPHLRRIEKTHYLARLTIQLIEEQKTGN